MNFLDGEIIVKINKSVLLSIKSYLQISGKSLEAGGVLLGRENANDKNIIIEYCTEPYSDDIRSRNKFNRIDRNHIDFFNKINKDYKMIYFYIGEWHTHPEDIPTPSQQDISNWKDLVRKDTSDIYYHIIAGRKIFRVWKQIGSKKCEMIYENDWSVFDE